MFSARDARTSRWKLFLEQASIDSPTEGPSDMKSLGAYKPVKGSTHVIPKAHKLLKATSPREMITVTLIVRRRKGGPKMREAKDFAVKAAAVHAPVNRAQFIADHGADPREIEQVIAFAKSNGLDVVETNTGARSVVVRGTAAKVNKAFSVKLNDYQGTLRKYHSHTGPAKLPGELSTIVEAVIGLHNRPIHARAHNTTARRRTAQDPANTQPVTPQQIAQLYGFPPGDGAGQTIGIYEMAVEDQNGQLANAGYTPQDVANTIKGFGGGLKVPKIIDVSVDGVVNSGVNDGETLLDITVAGAIAQAATIAVYFTGGDTQNIIHALQRMIHPGPGDPVPTVISISYGFGPDDDQSGFSAGAFDQMGELYKDAANLFITVLISSGDSGCVIGGSDAEASYPATEPMVIACGGTTVGNVTGSSFDEFVWNDVGAGGPGATGGGISAKFPVPSYQSGAGVPKHISTNKAGRGIPDLAGNASENSGYTQVAAGFQTQPVGGTSAVAPLYAGLFARINANLGVSVGFVNPIIYSLGKSAFRDTVAPPGPENNSFNGVTGYPVETGWDACTGWGSVKGTTLQNGLKAANAGSKVLTI
jgi:kumamolisin